MVKIRSWGFEAVKLYFDIRPRGEGSGAKPTLVDSRSPRGGLRGLGPVGTARGMSELTLIQISFVNSHPFGRGKNPEMGVRGG